MDFDWSERQTSLYDDALGFARAHLEKALDRRDAAAFPREAWAACGAFGLLGLSAPESSGGLGLDALTTARVLEAFGRGCKDSGFLFSAAAHLFACVMPIADHATPEIKAQILPGLCRGETVGANAITEAEAGSDVFAMAATARRDGDAYILDGVKSYVTNAPAADELVVYASTNRAHGYMGVSAFVVSRNTPGLTIGTPIEKIGLRTAPLSSIYLEGCRVPADRLLAKEGQGGLVFQSSMQWERACLFALYLGAMDRQVDEVVAFAKARKQGKRPIGKYQAVSHRIVEMKLRLEAARLLLYRGCWSLDRGGDPTVAIALAKLAVSEAAVESSLDAIRIHGGAGVVTEVGVEHALRDAVPGLIFSGTSDIQKNLVAVRLGL